MGQGDAAENWNKRSAPVSAEPVAYGWDCAGTLIKTRATMESFRKDGVEPIQLFTAPVAAQPDLTQQTLDDVKAGIPARDAEIEALQKRNKGLLAQAVEDIAVIHRLGCRLAEISEVVTPDVPLEQHDTADLLDRVKKAVSAQAQQAVSGADQFRDAAQMIEPSGISGELPELPGIAPTDDWDSVLDCIKKYGMACYQAALQNLPQNIPEIIPESAQQDADKVDTDPLQGAADWMVKDCGVKYIAELARRLSIGYNRATRLMEAARKEQA